MNQQEFINAALALALENASAMLTSYISFPNGDDESRNTKITLAEAMPRVTFGEGVIEVEGEGNWVSKRSRYLTSDDVSHSESSNESVNLRLILSQNDLSANMNRHDSWPHRFAAHLTARRHQGTGEMVYELAWKKVSGMYYAADKIMRVEEGVGRFLMDYPYLLLQLPAEVM